jgi:hypothetical protein
MGGEMVKEREEFELIPMSPIRKLEKRIDQLEAAPNLNVKDFMHEIVEVVRMNQQLVDEMAKANDALRIELSKLPGRLEDLISNMNELISYIKASAAEETATGSVTNLQPLLAKMDELIEENKKVVESNQSVLLTLEQIDKKLRRSVQPVQPLRKPLVFRPQTSALTQQQMLQRP